MRPCPYCGYSNYEYARVCRKCEVALTPQASTVYEPGKPSAAPPLAVRSRRMRNRGLTLILLGLLMQIYWGGYSPWPPLDSPRIEAFRHWAEPLMFICGATLYVLGWVLRRA